jgi:cobalt-zinc-cadmium efflux system outer membrane protein
MSNRNRQKILIYELPLASANGFVRQNTCGFSQNKIKKSFIRIALAKALRNYFNFYDSAKAFMGFQPNPLTEASGNSSFRVHVSACLRQRSTAEKSRLKAELRTLAQIFLVFFASHIAISSQTTEIKISSVKTPSSVEKYLNQSNGKTVDDLVKIALENNDELAAVRKEAESAEALIKQADLRANPMLEVGAAKNPATPARSFMVKGSLPLELFGRRGARVEVAKKEAEIRRNDLANRERILAAEVRSKFGETIALALKLEFIEDTLALATQNYNLVVARVEEGKNAPLEQGMESVELNRIRAMRETSEGKVEISLLELKNLVGLAPEEILTLRGGFEDLLEPLPPQEMATQTALQNRPDLQTARAMESLAEARIEQAKIQGKPDATVNAGYERARQMFPQKGFDDLGNLTPIREEMNVLSVGVTLNLPVFDRNQGTVEASVLEKNAAAKRVEFGELTVKREIAASYVQYQRAARAMEIFRVGVENQAEINLSVVRQIYELGKQNLLDYIVEQRRFIEIKEDFIDTQLETYLARVEILSAISAPELRAEK